MDMDIFQGMPDTELKKYIEFLLWHYRVVDAFWFIYVNEQFDQPIAELINEKVWSRVSGMAAKDLKSRFNIQEAGLKGLVQVMSLFPWCILTHYQIGESDNEVLITVPSCTTQEARIRRGLDEFNCKDMHRGAFISFARAIDERIRVECLFAPPDSHPENIYCKWRMYLDDTQKDE